MEKVKGKIVDGESVFSGECIPEDDKFAISLQKEARRLSWQIAVVSAVMSHTFVRLFLPGNRLYIIIIAARGTKMH